MRHTLLFISSVALAAVLATTTTIYAADQVDQADTAKPDQAPAQGTESADIDTDSGGDATESKAADETATEESAAEPAESEASTSAETSETPDSSSSSDSSDSAETATEEASEKPAEGSADASVTPSEGAAVYIIYPSDGSEVTSPVKVVFGLDGLGVAPAGVDVPDTGHHHLIIDGGDELPPAGEVMGDNVMHFGGGQTEADIEMEPGEHTLQLILGDKEHKPFEPSLVSEKITIKVVKP